MSYRDKKFKIGQKVMAKGPLCNIEQYDSGDIEHTCIAKEGDVGTIISLDHDGNPNFIEFLCGVYWSDYYSDLEII